MLVWLLDQSAPMMHACDSGKWKRKAQQTHSPTAEKEKSTGELGMGTVAANPKRSFSLHPNLRTG